MKVQLPEEFTEEQMKRLTEFFKEAIYFTDEENASLDGIVPMTCEMFKHLGERLLEIGCEEHYYELLIKYPDFVEREAAEIEEELKDLPDDFPEETEKEKEARWEQFKQKIREKYGEDAI